MHWNFETCLLTLMDRVLVHARVVLHQPVVAGVEVTLAGAGGEGAQIVVEGEAAVVVVDGGAVVDGEGVVAAAAAEEEEG